MKISLRKLTKSIEPGGRAEYGLETPNLLIRFLSAVLLNLAWLGWRPSRRIPKWWLIFSYVVWLIPGTFYYIKRQKFKQRYLMLKLGQLLPDANVLAVGT